MGAADEAERTYGDIDDVEVASEGGWNAQFVDGEWRSAAGRKTIAVNATTRSPVGEVPRGTTDDLAEAFAVAERAQEEWANTPPQAPFGGVKASGMGRYNDRWIADEFTTTRWISVQHEPRQYH